MPIQRLQPLLRLFLAAILYFFPSQAAPANFSSKIANYCQALLSNSKSLFKGAINSMDAKDIIEIFGLSPLPGEGGYFKEVYRAPYRIPEVTINGQVLRDRNASTSIYYMVTPQTFSSLHRLPQDEIFHFYMGEPAEMLIIYPNGHHELVTLGPDPKRGQRSQFVVPGGSWQGTRLAPGKSKFALLGTTVSPGFEFVDMELKSRSDLIQTFPHLTDFIKRYTVEK
jgi:predicted cupin superfamily sugar epimerase